MTSGFARAAHEHAKLVAAEPGDDVGFAEILQQVPRERCEHAVAGLVTASNR